MQSKEHWDRVYATKPTESVSWFQEHAEQSLRLIRGTGVPRSGAIIDVGGGAAVLRSVKPGGHVIVATFDEDSPTRCSGLPVMRYCADELHAEFGAPFTLLSHEKEEHRTPFGTVQKFVYCYCRKSSS